MINSPLSFLSLKDKVTDLRDLPSNRFEKISDHSTTKPQLDGSSGEVLRSCFLKIFTQDPSEPSFGHDAPPKERRVISA